MEEQLSALQISPTPEAQRQPFKVFAPFSRLPPELRFQIWKYAIQALDGGRIIPLSLVTRPRKVLPHFGCKSTLPPIASVSWEAQAMTLENMDLEPLFSPNTKHAAVKADLRTDTIMIRKRNYSKAIRHFFDAIGEEKARSIRRLALEIEIKDEEKWWESPRDRAYEYPLHHQSDIDDIWRACPDLESLVIVAHRDGKKEGRHKYHGELIFVEPKTFTIVETGSEIPRSFQGVPRPVQVARFEKSMNAKLLRIGLCIGSLGVGNTANGSSGRAKREIRRRRLWSSKH